MPVNNIVKQVKARVPCRRLEKVAELVKRKTKRRPFKVSLVIVSAKTIKDLNNKYRQKNQVTDVLSFNNQEGSYLGDILVCYQQARQQAKQKNHSAQREITILYLHGLLHLLGYDHKKISQAKAMERLEENILSNVYR